jgi:hypothetical protein
MESDDPSDETIRTPRSAVWGAAAPPFAAAPFAAPPPAADPVRHNYPLTVRDPSLGTAIGLMMQSLPYALARLAILFAASIIGIIWLCVVVGGAAWLGAHIAQAFGWAWFIGGVVCTGFIWGTVLRYALHLIECGHVAVLTELITKGQIGNGSESMFAYGRRVVTERFGEATLLFGLNATVRGVLGAFHRALDFVAELLPIPGLETISSLINIILRAATRYLDKVIFSYSLARAGTDPVITTREGLIYYAQNAKPILKTAIWVVILDRVLTALLWVVLMVPAAGIVLLLPTAVRETGGLVTIIVAALFAGCLRAAIIKPIFLIMMMVRFHSAAEGQLINLVWDDRLAQLSDKFRDMGTRMAGAFSGRVAGT